MKFQKKPLPSSLNLDTDSEEVNELVFWLKISTIYEGHNGIAHIPIKHDNDLYDGLKKLYDSGEFKDIDEILKNNKNVKYPDTFFNCTYNLYRNGLVECNDKYLLLNDPYDGPFGLFDDDDEEPLPFE